MKTILINVLVLVLICFFGCSRQASTDSEMKINALKKKVGDLSAKIEKLNRQLDVLVVTNERLEDKNTEIGEWADRVVSRFGKGVWYLEDLNYPFFVESMKNSQLSDLIDHLNQRFRKDKLPEILYLDKKEGTVFVGVSDDEQLSRQMGSFGASSYMNAVVFTLASMDDISCVTFKFEGGDHAVPGTYCRSFIQK